MVYTSQRGQALIEVIGTLLVLLTFAFLYFNFSVVSKSLLNQARFSQERH